MTKQTCEVVSIELETKPWKPEGKGEWVVTADHSEKSEFRLPESPSTSQVEAELAEDLAELKDADADLVAEVSEHTSPMTPDTNYSLDSVRVAETDQQDDGDDGDDGPEVVTDGGEESPECPYCGSNETEHHHDHDDSVSEAITDGAPVYKCQGCLQMFPASAAGDDNEGETTSQQDDVAEWLSTKRLSDESREWTVEVDTINDGRPAVRVSWEPGTDASLPTVDEERLPHGWQIVQFGVGVSSEIGESDDKRYLVVAPRRDSNIEPAMYDALARELTASELRDYLAVERFGYSQTGWAEESGLNRPNVSERVNSARRKLEE